MAVFLIPLRMQVSEDFLAAFVGSQRLKDSEIVVDQPQRVMNSWGAQEDMEVIDLLPGFLVWREENHGALYLEGDGHWNEQAHRAAADLVANELVSRSPISTPGEPALSGASALPSDTRATKQRFGVLSAAGG